MPYNRPYAAGFIDYPNTTTPLTASVLNTMDLGIKTANDQIQTLTTTQRNAISSPTIGQLVWDSDLEELFVYLNGSAGNAWFGIGNHIICTMATRPATPVIGQTIYQTDTDEVLKYVTDADGTARWMLADHDYRRNVVINGGFDVWQRGSPFNPASAVSTSRQNYGADCWQFLQATTSASAFSQGTITSTDPVGFNYYARVQRANTLTLTTAYTVQTSFESQNIQQFRGKYVTLSFWARAGANYSAASSFLVSDIVTGTGIDNTVGNFTTNTVNTTTNNVLTTSWKRFSITTSAVLAATITQLGVRFVFTPVGTAGAADYFDITGVQVEPSSAPSNFEFRDAGEQLSRCQRYFLAFTGSGNYLVGQAVNTSTATFILPAPIRAAGGLLANNLTVFDVTSGNLTYTPSSSTFTKAGYAINFQGTTSASLTAGRAVNLVGSTGSYLYLSADL